MTRQEFIKKIKSKALELQIKYIILPSLTISQATCESDGGESSLASKYYNLFGFKWTEGCGYDYVELWTSEFVNGKYIRIKAKFRKYKNWNESLEDYGRLIGTTNRYRPVRECKDYICATEQIRKCGYATSPTYTQTLRGIIKQYKLYELDKKKYFIIGDDDMKLYVLKKGVKGNFVKWLQEILEVEYGFKNEYSGGWDGDFGTLTENQVKAYQKDNELPVNGIVEMETVINLIDYSGRSDYWMRRLQIYMGFE